MFLKLSVFVLAAGAFAAPPTYFTEGVKVGEVTPDSALVWTRLSSQAEPVPGRYRGNQDRAELEKPLTVPVATLPGAVAGAPGRIRLRCGGRWLPWVAVTEATDFTHIFRLNRLTPATRYQCRLESDGGGSLEFEFRTAPRPAVAAPVRFTVVTGLMHCDLDGDTGFRIFEAMRADPPDFLVLTGDNVYYDNETPRARTPEIARYHWQRMFSLPRHRALFARIPAYWMKDDHDILSDDCWPGRDPDFMRPMTFAEGLRIFAQQTPVAPPPYRTFRWGRDLQIWLPEQREFRSPNNLPDSPAKTILGAEQKRWLKESVARSDAQWKIIVSPTPWVGPDRPNKADNYSNKGFATEGAEMRRWAASVPNLFVITGDRHWQYHSVDPETGLNEFACGPASDEHAEGSPGEDRRYHRFHLVKGGYSLVKLTPQGARSSIEFHLVNVSGAPVYQWSPR